MEGELLEFQDETSDDDRVGHTRPWKILIVDDEPAVHRVTHLALDGFQYQDRPVVFVEAYSATQAIDLLAAHPDVAVVLLDVVMETDNAGFRVVEHIRNTLANTTIRIILRTGQPGQAPAREVIQRYGINDYHNKADLTAERMYIAVYTAIAMFDHLQTIEHREQQLQMAYAEIEQLVYISSHDLREPLLSVATLSQRLLEMKHDQLNDEGLLYLEYIGSAVRRMSELVNGLLDHARLGQTHPREMVPINDLLDELREEMAPLIAETQTDLVYAGLPKAFGERPKIKLLLQHLITNAIKYRRLGHTPVIRITAEKDAGDPVYAVTDNGIGIPAEHRERVFDVFVRLHHRDQFEGTGIGLAHCRKIVAQHGGRIWVESPAEHGTTVRFSLPKAPDSKP